MKPTELAKLLALPELPVYLQAVQQKLRQIGRAAGPGLSEPALRAIDSGGKRLRPALVIAAAASRGGKVDKRVIAAATALELVHQASLIHDDIIDKSELRRGLPSIVHKEGLNAAILLGDYFLAAGMTQAATVSQEAACVLSTAIAAMCQGQSLELTKNYKAGPKNVTYQSVVRKKSAALISAACRLGALAASLPKEDAAALSKYGEYFGVAFQIIDDITDGDFSNDAVGQALAEAKRYNRLATRPLNNFDKPVARAMANLPAFYLDTAVNS